ncbi:MAG: hypothetical protein DME87_10375 [Verrucomicrobia bacterium]|nr:MAG: hypothetical protein DME87_10375 [Verrucomicrobiota bacterium]
MKKATNRLVTGEVVMSSSRTRKAMQTGSETAGDKAGSSGVGVDPQKEAAYWLEQHPKQPYAKNGSYEQFEHAYKTGYNSFFKYRGQNFVDVEDSIALDYERAKPDSALPWDTVRPAVNAVWERMTGVISPRDPGRGVRDWI